jgi:RHS repeat-associated protein
LNLEYRSDASSVAEDNCTQNRTYEGTLFDGLTSVSATCGTSGLGPSMSYTYDDSGAVTQQSVTSAGTWNLTTAAADLAGTAHGGLDTVFSAITVHPSGGGSFAYNYYYDSQNRRRSKVYPTGVSDEFFYDQGDELLVDQGNDSVTSAIYHTTDEYIWVGGRPLAVLRGRLDLRWNRVADSTSTCGRNGDTQPCGVTYIVTDHIGKPVVMFDASQNPVNAFDYDSFGHQNRTRPWAVDGTSDEFSVPLADQLDVRVLADAASGTLGTGPFADPWTPASQRTWSAWLNSTDGTASCPGCKSEWYEYRRYRAGVAPVSTPLRFPGQYFDQETDLFQNWNRFYEAGTGRYWEREPLLSGTVLCLIGGSIP